MVGSGPALAVTVNGMRAPCDNPGEHVLDTQAGGRVVSRVPAALVPLLPCERPLVALPVIAARSSPWLMPPSKTSPLLSTSKTTSVQSESPGTQPGVGMIRALHPHPPHPPRLLSLPQVDEEAALDQAVKFCQVQLATSAQRQVSPKSPRPPAPLHIPICWSVWVLSVPFFCGPTD